MDIARLDHWDSVWKQVDTVRGFSLWNYYDYRLSTLFQASVKPGSSVVEVGCGGSRWIGFFAGAMRCETWGIDYSAEGLRITEHENIGSPNVHLVMGDFFDDSQLPRDHFDLVYSLGFIEHFTETAAVTRRMMDLLRPGGRVMTLVPNFMGAYGVIQKRVNRPTFEKHVIIDCDKLDQAHVVAGMHPLISAHYFGCFGPGVVDYGPWQWLVLPPVKLLQHLGCWLLHGLNLDRECRLYSPYIVGVYEKPKQM